MQISDISRVVETTLSRQLFMLAKQYDDCIDFTLGDPDLPTPKTICEAANQAAINGKTRYTPNAGLWELRNAIANEATKSSGINYEAENVTITVGATEAFYLAFKSILNEGDEVIIIAPYWVQYENICKLLKANPIIVDKFIGGFNPDIEAVRSVITDKTKVIVFNSPNNPSGCIYNEEILKKIAHIAVEHNLYVFADEVYKSLIYQLTYPTIAKYCPRKNLLIFNSFSKQFAMTGWRIGYVIAEKELTDIIVKMQQNIAVCVSTLSQYAALEAIKHSNYYSNAIRNEFSKRRDLLIKELRDCPNITCNAPQGTFYVFLDISATGLSAKDFSFKLLEKEHVATIPGIAFGKAFNNYVRLAFTINEDKIREGIRRIKNFINTI